MLSVSALLSLSVLTFIAARLSGEALTLGFAGQVLITLLAARWVAGIVANIVGLTGASAGQRSAAPPNEKALQETLEGDHHEFREELKQFLREDMRFRVGAKYYEGSIEEQRASTHERLRLMLNESSPTIGSPLSVHDITNDPRKLIAAHEVTLAVNPAFTYAMSVHMNLFGGSLLKLGTERHHKAYLGSVDDLTIPGCFALTEVGHGVLSGMHLDTTATYDRATCEFVINTPTVNARKNWISFAAETATSCVVFAVLYTAGPGEEPVNEGIHAFIVDFRDAKTRAIVPGVFVEHMGHKPTLNGNDNARMWFKNFRVKRECLLDRFSSVAADGSFESAIANKRQRFLKVSDQLMTGRMCIGSACLYAARLATMCAVRYAISKEQTVKEGKKTELFNHLSQRRPLLSAIAEIYAMTFVQHETKTAYASLTHDEHVAQLDIATERKESTLRAVCSLKSYAAQENVRITDMCRNKCGGQSLVTENQLGQLSNCAVSLVVVEGDSCILAQKVVGELVKAAFGQGGTILKMGRLAVLSAKVAASNAALALRAFAGVDRSMYGTLLTLHYETRLAALARRLLVSLAKGSFGRDWSTKETAEILELHHCYAEQNAYAAFRRAIATNSEGVFLFTVTF